MMKEKVHTVLDKIKQSKKNKIALVLPLAPLLIMLFLVVNAQGDGNGGGAESMLVDLDRSEAKEFNSKTEAYRAKQDKLGEVESRNKKLSSDGSFFNSWDDESLGYLENDSALIDNSNVVADIAGSTVNPNTYSPIQDFGGRNNYSPSNDIKSGNNDQSTQQIYGGDPNPTYGNQVDTPPEKNRRGALGGNYGGETNDETVNKSSITAVIHNQNRVIKGGSSVRMRLTEEYKVGKYTIPKNHIITGIASLSAERVMINISSIRLGNEVIPVKLTVYELDGLRGIYDEELLKYDLTNDLADESINQGETRIELGNFGSISTDGLKKKKDEPRVTIPENHKIILKQSR